jgi:hypothetical protein
MGLRWPGTLAIVAVAIGISIWVSRQVPDEPTFLAPPSLVKPVLQSASEHEEGKRPHPGAGSDANPEASQLPGVEKGRSPIPENPLTTELLARDAWLTLGGFGPDEPDFDQRLRERAKRREPINAWDRFKPFRAGIYDGLIDTLGSRRKRFVFTMQVVGQQSGSALKVLWLEPSGSQNVEPARKDYSRSTSIYADEEIFQGTVSFPYDSYWRMIAPGDCQGILILHSGLYSDESSNEVHGFQGRIYCRKGLDDIYPVAQMAAASRQR